MKLSEIKLNKDFFTRFFRTRGLIFFSLFVIISFIGMTVWSFLFLSAALQKAFDIDQKRVEGETPAVDLESYSRLKESWKDFENGKYVKTVIPNTLNTNTANVNDANTNTSNTNTENSNANVDIFSNTNTNSNTSTLINTNNSNTVNTNSNNLNTSSEVNNNTANTNSAGNVNE